MTRLVSVVALVVRLVHLRNLWRLILLLNLRLVLLLGLARSLLRSRGGGSSMYLSLSPLFLSETLSDVKLLHKLGNNVL